MSFFRVELDSNIVIFPCPLRKDCANPDHVGPATPEEIGDKILRIMRRKRKTLMMPTLSEAAVQKIYQSTTKPHILAKRHNVRVSYIRDIQQNRSYTDITRELDNGSQKEANEE